MDGEPLSTLALVLTGLNYTIILFLVPRILLQRREPRGTLAWILFVILVPFLGLIAFSVLGGRRLRMRYWRRRERTRRGGEGGGASPFPAPSSGEPAPVETTLHRLALRLDPMGQPSDRHAVVLLDDGPAIFDSMEEAIDAAEGHVHAMFYAWLPDGTGERMRDALCRAARRGAAVRLLLDDVGSAEVRDSFFRPLVEAGGESRRFLPVNLFARRISLNHRNHRKILVTDGRVGFTGGANVGDDYAGRGAPWYDAQVRLEGPAVGRLQAVFCQDWFRAGGEDLSGPEHFPAPLTHPSGALVQVLESGPDLLLHTIHLMTIALLMRAAESVRVVTPYFVPDASVVLALRIAALQGADVRLVVPAKTDHPMVSHAARTFYEDLLESGVRVFEARGRFVHAKMLSVDGHFATVGSANLDERSQRLNFEANAFVHERAFAGAVERACTALEADCVEVELSSFRRRPSVQRLKEALARLSAPVL